MRARLTSGTCPRSSPMRTAIVHSLVLSPTTTARGGGTGVFRRMLMLPGMSTTSSPPVACA
eukprot:13457961-Heterocapsa_arctica.AAC.1